MSEEKPRPPGNATTSSAAIGTGEVWAAAQAADLLAMPGVEDLDLPRHTTGSWPGRLISSDGSG